MLFIKGRVNSVKRVEPEGKKPYYNVQFISEGANGALIPTWARVYSDSDISIGDELEVQVKVNAWDKDKYQLIGFMR